MPIVPGVQPTEPASPLLDKPSPENLMMALATMKDLGRLPSNQLTQVTDKKSQLDLVTKHMDDDEYNASWIKSVARKGRSDAEMRALEPDLEAYRLDENSDLITYHKRKPPPEKKPEDLVS